MAHMSSTRTACLNWSRITPLKTRSCLRASAPHQCHGCAQKYAATRALRVRPGASWQEEQASPMSPLLAQLTYRSTCLHLSRHCCGGKTFFCSEQWRRFWMLLCRRWQNSSWKRRRPCLKTDSSSELTSTFFAFQYCRHWWNAWRCSRFYLKTSFNSALWSSSSNPRGERSLSCLKFKRKNRLNHREDAEKKPSIQVTKHAENPRIQYADKVV